MPKARPMCRCQAPQPRSGAPKAQGLIAALRPQHNPPCRRSRSLPPRRPPITSTNAAAPAAPQLQSRISTSLTDVTQSFTRLRQWRGCADSGCPRIKREGPRVRIHFPPPASLSHQCLPCLPPERPGFCRECEPGRDQRTGRAGREPARLGCFSLTGIAAVPPQEIKAQQREEPRPWPGHPLLRVALQLARRLR
jgi:hypothetical protein